VIFDLLHGLIVSLVGTGLLEALALHVNLTGLWLTAKAGLR
jgi:hypothetical protein